MRTLVTGGNRYIGLSLVNELVERGHEVTVINSHEAPLPAGVRRINCDRRRPGALSEALAGYRDAFDVIYDHTAYVLDDMIPLVEFARGCVEHYIFTSSQAVYLPSEVQPIREDSPRYTVEMAGENLLARYGAKKAECEDRLFDLWEKEKFPATVLRVSHTMGPRSAAPTRDPGFFARIEANRPVLIPGEGFPIISLVHIDDAAAMMASLIGNQAVKGESYNVSSAEAASVRGIIGLIGKAMDRRVEVVSMPIKEAAQLQPPIIHWAEAYAGSAIISIEKALRDVNWKPRFGIESGFRDSYQWYDRGGRDHYSFDFSQEDALLRQLGHSTKT